MSRPILLVDLEAQQRRLGDRITQAVNGVLEHGRFISGPEVEDLERRLAATAGTDHVVACGSGTEALLLPLLAWGVGPGDAVIVPAFTFAATAEVVALAGSTPIFADVDSSFNLSAPTVEQALTFARQRGHRVAGIITVDLFGVPAPYDELELLAERHGCWLLADAAQSFGATRGGRTVGQFGHATATSFFPSKPLGCYGDGGAVLTKDVQLAETMRSLRVHGQGADKYDNVRVGINGRLDTLQAAVLLAKLDIFSDELRSRRLIAETYNRALDQVVGTPSVPAGIEPAWAQYTITTDNRDRVAAALKRRGIPTAVYYPRPLDQQPAYRRFPSALEGEGTAGRLARRVLSLPMHPYLDEEQQSAVATAVMAEVEAHRTPHDLELHRHQG